MKGERVIVLLLLVMCWGVAQAQEVDSLRVNGEEQNIAEDKQIVSGDVVMGQTVTVLEDKKPTPDPSLKGGESSESKDEKPTPDPSLKGGEYADTAIYQGINLKLDLANTIIEAATSKGKVLNFEMAMNIRLKHRYYPTFEAGYAQADTGADGGHQNGKGGFFRVGLDINPLKKHPERLSCLLVGVRLGTALQGYDLTNVVVISDYWGEKVKDFYNEFRADCWGEIVAGVQVQIWEGLQMGWYARMKILFTRTVSGENVMPYYIPGFGYRDESNWGFNYYIGYKF